MWTGARRKGPWPEGIDALLSTSPFGAAFSREYVGPALLAVSEKKRIRALAGWHFGDGRSYCAACPGRCAECPSRVETPLSLDGFLFWEAFRAGEHQLRIAGTLPIGFDFPAIAALARARAAPARPPPTSSTRRKTPHLPPSMTS